MKRILFRFLDSSILLSVCSKCVDYFERFHHISISALLVFFFQQDCQAQLVLHTDTVYAITQTTAIIDGSWMGHSCSNDLIYWVSWRKSGNMFFNYISTQISSPSASDSFSITIGNLIPGTDYDVRSYGASWCSASYGDTLTFTTLPASQAIFTVDVSSVCEGGSVQFSNASTGSIQSYEWSFPGGIPSSSSLQNPTQVSFIVNGEYNCKLVVTDSGGYKDTMSMTINVWPQPGPPSITPSGPIQELCEGEYINLQASGLFVNYIWLENFMDTVGLSGSVTLAPDLYQTTYSVIAIDSNGCESTGSLITMVNPLPNSDLYIDGSLSDTLTMPLHFCKGSIITLVAVSSGSISWSNGSIGLLNDTDSSGKYWFVSEDTVTGCSSSSDTVAIVFDSLPEPIIGSIPDKEIFCNEDSINLFVTQNFDKYKWYHDNFELIDSTKSINIDNEGEFTTAVFDGFCWGLSEVLEVRISDLEAPEIIESNCIVVAISTDNLNYQWFFNGSLIPGGTEQFLAVDSTGNYLVQVEDTNGCTVASDPYFADCKTNSIDGQEVRDGELLHIYPNPAYSGAWVHISEWDPRIKYSITILNSIGQIVFEQPALRERFFVDRGIIPAGIYMIAITAIQENRTETQNGKIVFLD